MDENGSVSLLANGKAYSLEVIEEAKKRIDERNQKTHHSFWFDDLEVETYLKHNSILPNLRAKYSLPVTVFVQRLLNPISEKDFDSRLVCRQKLRYLDALRRPLNPTDSLAATILQDLRSSIEHPLACQSIMRRLGNEDERENTLEDNEIGMEKPCSLRNLLMRCVSYDLDVPAKEEAFFFIATVAKYDKEVFFGSDSLFMEQILSTVANAYASCDTYVTDRRVRRHEYEMLRLTMKYSSDQLYVPQSFPVIKYRHEGVWAGHRMRSIGIYTAAVIFHHWKRIQLVETLISNCYKHRLISRLQLLRLLFVVLKNWPPSHSALFTDVTFCMMKKLWEQRTVVGEFKESQELMVLCLHQTRIIMNKPTTLSYQFQFHRSLGKAASPEKRQTSRTSSKSSKANVQSPAKKAVKRSSSKKHVESERKVTRLPTLQ